MVIARNARLFTKQRESTRHAAGELKTKRGDKRKGAYSMDFGQIAELVDLLESNDETKAYQCFKALEKESTEESSVYPFFDLFVEMTEDDNSYIRTRGLLLIAANARWDVDNKIDEVIDSCLKHISDEKPITSRQFIKALPSIVKWKPDLRECIVEALRKANPGVYKESMHSLVAKDITWALAEIEKCKETADFAGR